MLDPGTMFRKMFERGDLPISIRHGAKMTLEWKVSSVDQLNVGVFLPVFLDGIREKRFP